MLKAVCQGAKSYQGAQHEQPTIENSLLPEETSAWEEKSSAQEQEVIIQPQPSQTQVFFQACSCHI